MKSRTRGSLLLTAGLLTALSGCAVFDPLPTPGTRRQEGVPAALCPALVRPASGESNELAEFAGEAEPAISCLDAWRAAYYGALKDHTRFRAGQELLIGALSAKALYAGITEAGNGHHIAALGVGGALLYGNMVRRSPNPKLQVYAAGLRALSCAAIHARPLLMLEREHLALASAIEVQSAQLGALSGSLAMAAYSGEASAAQIDARNALNLMQVDLDRASLLRDRIAHAGPEIRAQVGRIVDNVTDELRATEPDPASITDLIKSYPQLAGTFAHGYLPSVSGATGAAGARGAGGANDSTGARTLSGDEAGTVKCADQWIVSRTADPARTRAAVVAETSTSVKVALFCAHRGAYELRIRMASVAAVEKVTSAIEGCGKPEDLKPAPSIALQPDVNRIDLKTAGSATISIRSTGGIPAVGLFGNAAGAIAPLGIDASLGYLIVQIKATDKTTPSPVLLAVTAPNGDTRQVEIVVSKTANDSPALKASPADGTDDGLSDSERHLLGNAGRIQALQCRLGMGEAMRAPRVGPATRARIAIAREILGLPQGNTYTSELEDALQNLSVISQCGGLGLSEDAFKQALRAG